MGDKIMIDTHNTVAYSKDRMIAIIGVDSLLIVETDDVVLVCDKNRAQDVKIIVDILKKQGKIELL